MRALSTTGQGGMLTRKKAGGVRHADHVQTHGNWDTCGCHKSPDGRRSKSHHAINTVLSKLTTSASQSLYELSPSCREDLFVPFPPSACRRRDFRNQQQTLT